MKLTLALLAMVLMVGCASPPPPPVPSRSEMVMIELLGCREVSRITSAGTVLEPHVNNYALRWFTTRCYGRMAEEEEQPVTRREFDNERNERRHGELMDAIRSLLGAGLH